jgi:hypothetical protein
MRRLQIAEGLGEPNRATRRSRRGWAANRGCEIAFYLKYWQMRQITSLFVLIVSIQCKALLKNSLRRDHETIRSSLPETITNRDSALLFCYTSVVRVNLQQNR